MGMKRNIFDKINELLLYFPIVAILGARQTGRRWLNNCGQHGHITTARNLPF
jgi:hypothetical protein